MKKLICHIMLVVGIVALIYSFWMPASEVWQNPYLNSTIPSMVDSWQDFSEYWLSGYLWMTLVSAGLILCGGWLLRAWRREDGKVEAGTAAALSVGVLLEVFAFLQAWPSAIDGIRFSGSINSILSGNGGALGWLDPSKYNTYEIPSTSAWTYLGRAYREQLWLVLLGIALIAAGIISAIRAKAVVAPPGVLEVAADALEKPTEEPEREYFEGGTITLFCTVMDIRGDYALVKYDDTGIESEVAIALLPFGIDVGDKLKYENYEFEKI